MLDLRAGAAGVAVLIALVVLVVAAATDALAVAWHAARERRAAGRAALIAMALEAAAWLPVLAAIETGDPRIAVAAVAGSGLGCALAIRRLR